MRFSVATPVFHGMPWLRLCVASVRAEAAGLPAGSAVEHLIQDGTPAEAEAPETFEPGRLRPGSYSLSHVRESDGGMYDAINRAWRRATGDIVSYLNCDEQYLPGTLERVSTYFEAHPDVDLLFGDALLIDGEGKLLSYRRVVPPSRAHTRVVHLGTLSCAMFFRRRVLEAGCFFDTRWRAIGDAEWVWRVLGRGFRAGVIPEPLAAFTVTGSNLGANPKALAEAAVWRAEAPAWQRALAPALRIEHWIRKAAAGAYRPHAVRTALFTVSSPDVPVIAESGGLGSRWVEG